MIKFLGSIVPFLVFHLFCCGALLGILITTGYLFLLSQEGQNKIFLLPALGLTILFFWFHKKVDNRLLNILLYGLFSLVSGLIFIIYIFIPWWIPNYQGGILLP